MRHLFVSIGRIQWSIVVRMRSWGVVLLLQACCAMPAKPLVHVSRHRINATPVEAFHTPDYSQLDKTQAETYTALHRQVDELVHTSEFGAALRDIDTLAPTPKGDRISGAMFAAMYLHQYSDIESLPLCYRFEAADGSETARTGTFANRQGCGKGKAAVAEITLHTVTLARASTEQLEAHACAVNTLAHEWTHALTIVDDRVDTGHRQLFDDGDHDHQPEPLAGYTVGAVAQCVYLARKRGGVEHFKVASCIEEVGTNAFPLTSCSNGWAERFVQ
ncbi:MAG: hypothetical protein ABIY55_06815 [Kofleriaceae bacterium]